MSEYIIKKLIEIHIPVNRCNLACSYCYIENCEQELCDIIYTIEEIKNAFSKERLGGTCLISICSNGETLLSPRIVQITNVLLREGHYVMLVTNGTVTKRIIELLDNENSLVERLFFKISFHYEEMKKRKMLDAFFENVERIKKSAASFTIEYIWCDESLNIAEEMKQICMEKLGALPQVGIPRDDRKTNKGICSKYTWKRFKEIYKKCDMKSEFWDFREQMFGKKCDSFCYAGERFLWVNLKNGYSYQCYQGSPLQNFMNADDEIIWNSIGCNCPEPHCYIAHITMTLGVVEPQKFVKYRPNYYEVRNRIDRNGEPWVKKTYEEIFKCGIER